MKIKTKRTSKRAARIKIRLRLPDLDQAKAAVLNSLRSPESQRGYEHSINEFIAWYCSEPRLSFNKTVVTRYRMHTLNRANWRQAQSMSDLPFGASAGINDRFRRI